MKTLSLGYSPCPNDTFIFYALVHRRIRTGGLQFREILEDVETLNLLARQKKLDITKVSFNAFGHLRDEYCLLRSGAALGRGCGPLIVARKGDDFRALTGKTIAVPGMHTTAFLLLEIFNPSHNKNVKVMPFHEIMNAVKSGEVDAGLIIHEGRFTYHKAGLHKVLDLGQWWEEQTGLPIPLGCIIARRELGGNTIQKTETLIRNSIRYAFSHREETRSYIKEHSQELEDAVIEQHINLYVNDFSEDIGSEGMRAVEELFRRAEEQGIIPRSSMPLFAVP